MVRLLQIIKIIAHFRELLNARYISGQIVGLISRMSWVRVPLSQYSVNRRRFASSSENKYEELRWVDSRLHSLGVCGYSLDFVELKSHIYKLMVSMVAHRSPKPKVRVRVLIGLFLQHKTFALTSENK